MGAAEGGSNWIHYHEVADYWSDRDGPGVAERARWCGGGGAALPWGCPPCALRCRPLSPLPSHRTLTDKAREFGAGPLFNAILPLLMQNTLEDQERHLLVKVIDRWAQGGRLPIA